MENTSGIKEGKTIYWEVLPPEELGPALAEAIENITRQKLTLAKGYQEIASSTHPWYASRRENAATQVIPAIEEADKDLQLIEIILRQGPSHALPIDKSASKPRIALDHLKALQNTTKR